VVGTPDSAGMSKRLHVGHVAGGRRVRETKASSEAGHNRNVDLDGDNVFVRLTYSRIPDFAKGK